MTRRLYFPWTTLHSDSTSTPGDFNAVTMYSSSAKIKSLRVVFEVQNSTDASAVVQGGYNLCNVESSPDSPSILPGTPNTQTGDGVSYPTEKASVGSAFAAKTQVRLGFFMKASTAGLKACRVRGYFEMDDC